MKTNLIQWQPGVLGYAGYHDTPHDDRFEHNPPKPTAPAMGQEQFDFDNQRAVDEALLLNPNIVAAVLYDLRERVKALEAQINDN